MKYSYVIPCYNSSRTIAGVVSEIDNAMASMQETDYEIVLVNDFSRDTTREVIFDMARKRSNLKAISFAKNFGQHAALLAGYRYAEGDYIISLDDDGQTPANQVGRLIDKLNEGYDVVFANYAHKHHSWFRNFGSRINDLMARNLINKPKDLYLSSYFIARRFVIEEILNYRNPFPYVSGLLLRTTGAVTNVNVDHRDRRVGSSGYTLSSLFKLWLNGFTAFSIKPLRVANYIGIMIALFGFILAIYSIINKFTNPNAVIGWTSVIAAVTIIGGMILIMLGLIGEYLGRVYISMNESPQYVIRDAVGIPQSDLEKAR